MVLTIAILLIWFGEYTEEGMYSLGGLFFLFLIGMTIIIPGTLEIPNGENVTISTDNTTGIITEVHTPTTTTFSDTLSHSVGIWITLIAIFGFTIKLGQIREGFKQEP